MSVNIPEEELRGREQIAEGDTLSDLYEDDDKTYILELVKSISLNELHLSIFHERCDEQLESEPEYYTCERYDVDEVTELIHGCSAEEAMQWVMEQMEQAFNG